MRPARRAVLASAVSIAVAAIAPSVRGAPRTIPIVARKFVFIPRVVHLKVGEAVNFELTAPEVVMGLYAPDLELRALIVPGKVSNLAFKPTKAGTFPFICDVFCGEGHEAMSGEIVVT
jgi:cytochrome c oxidase subunit II